jgi:predicted metal-dependent HD superfamily phosphohydrolase
MSDTHEWLQDNWFYIFAALPVAVERAQSLLQELLARYAEPHRHYHNLEHLHQVLATAVALQPLADDFTAVQLAAWFHDAVYDPRAADNEARSAAYAVASLRALGLPPAQVTAVERLILATRSHLAEPGDHDAHVLLDADLAILGSDPEQYDAYTRVIRREYEWVPEVQYRHGRRQVLERFVARESIYHTTPMMTVYEQAARSNLQRELTRLSAS